MIEQGEEKAEAIFHAVEMDQGDEVARLLLDDPRVMEMEDEEQNRPLHVACQLGLTSVAALLLERGAEVDATNEEENTPLHLVARRGNAETLELLLRHGATATARNEWDETPLMLAAEEGHLWLVARLVSQVGEAELDARDVDGQTALCCACLRGQVDVTRLLLRAGADPHVRTIDARTAIMEARDKGHTACVQLLQWWDGELVRIDLLHRARCLFEMSTMAPPPPVHVPSCLWPRLHAQSPLPTVTLRGLMGQGEEEETRRAVLHFVMADLSAELYRELLEGIHPW